ncbi:hypothetical protein [Bacillus sp. V5-8f]|uniref:hypothetical protein n=1 Tax=Bacillus sp. V5-8f TaxID=2053044 RepID=UPI000C78F1EE|nr:hypothetical protein [Bacillus sp. V5-8f]PLT35741.1 hypothetical protein CUU64_00215 [Bacillus sp. V5-8f]
MKKQDLAKVLAVTTAFSGVVAVGQPTDVEAASSAQNSVVKAEKLAAKLAAEINYDTRKKLYPKSPVDLPNAKLHKDTLTAYNQAFAAVKKAKGKEKTVLQTRLSQKVKPTLDRTTKYIAAVNTGKKLLNSTRIMDVYLKSHRLDNTSFNAYVKVANEIKQFDSQVKYVYGTTTRAALANAYSTKAKTVKNTASFTFSWKNNTEYLAAALKQENYAKAQSYNNYIQRIIADNNTKQYLWTQSNLYKKLMANYLPLKEEMTKHGVIYTAVSKVSSKPTTVGGSSAKPVTLNQNVTIFAGKDTHIKLANVVVNGNIIVKGDKTGSGTVSLENVKVNKGTTSGGQIIVEDIADHSLYLNNVQADDLVVNDANGSNIVAQSTTKINNVTVTEKAGAQGKISINSAQSGAFGAITVAAQGNAQSEGVSLKGDFSTTQISVTGANASISVEAGAKVGSIEVKAAAKIDVAQGATVSAITKDPAVTGKVEVDNKGTVEKADEGVSVGGTPPKETTKPSNPPTTPTTPTTPPSSGGGGGGGGGSTPPPPPTTLPVISSPVILIDGTRDVPVANNQEVDLSSDSFDNSFKFKGLEITNGLAGSQVTITSVKSMSRNLELIQNPITVPVSSTGTASITTTQILGGLDTGADGVSLGILRSVLNGGDIKVEGNITKTGYQAYPINATIKLGPGASASIIENKYFKIAKTGTTPNNIKTAEVTIYTNEDVTIGQLNQQGIYFTTLLAAALDYDSVDVNGGSADTIAEIETAVRLVTNGNTLELTKLANLADRTITFKNYQVVFKTA